MPITPPITPCLQPLPIAAVKVGGLLGQRSELTWRGNLLALNWEQDFIAPFRTPNAPPGFYVGLGKTLDALINCAANTGDAALLAQRHQVITALCAAQAPDGYLGTYAAEARIIRLWDVHEQAYLLLALVNDWQTFRDERSLTVATRLATYLLAQLTDDVLPRIGHESFGTLGEALALIGLDRALLAFHRATGAPAARAFVQDQLRLATWDLPIVEGRFGTIDGHMYAYLTRCLAQLELYELTGDPRLLAQSRRVFDFLDRQRALVVVGTNSISECWHRDQTGTGELGETCGTAYLIRWLGKLLQLEGDARYGDWLERAIYNALFAAQSPDGRQLRYYTPFSGPRSYWPRDTYCCPGNFRRIVAELPGLVAFRHAAGLAVNLYTACRLSTTLADGTALTLTQTTDYPTSGDILLTVAPAAPRRFALRLRRPRWCTSATLQVNGVAMEAPAEKGFWVLDRAWQAGDQVALHLAMPWRLVRGFRQQAGRVAILRGPQVFALSPGELAAADLELLPATLAPPMPDATVRPGGVGCRLQAQHPGGAAPVTVQLAEYPAPTATATYFACGDTRLAVDDELFTPQDDHAAH